MPLIKNGILLCPFILFIYHLLMSSYLQELNEAQRAAVLHREGPAIIIAGPGSGKTRVLTYRIAHLLQHGVEAYHILALTFTNKAAREMKERIERIAGNEARSLWMGTFHSVFAKILRVEHARLGYPANFTIYDTQDSKSLITAIVKEQGLNPELYKPNYVYNRISSAKNSLITPADYAANAEMLAEDQAAGRSKMLELYHLYTDRCFKAGAMDFDDLLVKMYELLQRFPDELYKYQTKFQFVMVDEFQDTNQLQYEIVRRLAARHGNICVVGDDAQSIYAFRGATIANILNFEKEFPDRAVFKLEQNYRSTRHIVQAANDIIARNKNQLQKTIWTDNEQGVKIKITRNASDNEEARIVADTILEETLRNHYSHRDFAILYRTNAQSRAFEEALRRANIPYIVYGGLSFYQRKEIKDIMAYLKLTVNHFDEEALRRVVNYPTRGIGDTSLNRLSVWAHEQNQRLWEAMEQVQNSDLPARAKNAVYDFVMMIKSFAAMLDKKNAYEVAAYIAKTTQLQSTLYDDKTVEGVSRYENLQELLNSIKEFSEGDTEDSILDSTTDKSLGSYLQQVMLLTDQDDTKENRESVKLMTIHAAKGLEFAMVFLGGMEEELFPSRMAMATREELEEERRLFYVAVTRAEKKLMLSYATSRYRFGTLNYCEPSRFLQEISANIVETKGGALLKNPASFSGGTKPSFLSEKGSYGDARNISQTPPPPKIIKSSNTPAAGSDFVPPADFREDDTTQLKAGSRVLHQRFGIGVVRQVEGAAGNRLAVIDFEGSGEKRIMLRFAKLMIIS